jgi:hypothetical protein
MPDTTGGFHAATLCCVAQGGAKLTKLTVSRGFRDEATAKYPDRDRMRPRRATDATSTRQHDDAGATPTRHSRDGKAPTADSFAMRRDTRATGSRRAAGAAVGKKAALRIEPVKHGVSNKYPTIAWHGRERIAS